MQRQAPVAIGALAACAVFASGSILLREQILSFGSWPSTAEGTRGPEIAIPHGPPLVADGGETGPSLAAIARDVVRRHQAGGAAALAALGLGPGGGSLVVAAPREPVAGVTPGASHAPGAGNGRGPAAPTTVTTTTTGPEGSGAPAPASGAPLSSYGGGSVTGDAAPASSGGGSSGAGTAPDRPGVSIFVSVTGSRTATPEAASVTPDADPAPGGATDDIAAPPSDAAAPAPAPAEEAPPADPAPPVETAPPPTDDTPAPPPADPPAADPVPEAPPAPADPTPPADPAPAPDPAPTVAPAAAPVATDAPV